MHINLSQILDLERLHNLIVVNRDIMIRTLCLIFAFAWFTNEGAKFGDVTLAANAILMQLVTFSAFFLDGFALAAETLVGAAVGAKNRGQFDKAVRLSSELALATSFCLSIIFYISGSWIIRLMSNVSTVQDKADEYLIWVILAPLMSVWCYLLDGVFIGATRTVEMRNAMIVSLSGFLAAWYLSQELLWQSAQNHGLWASLTFYFVVRALTLNYYLPGLRRSLG